MPLPLSVQQVRFAQYLVSENLSQTAAYLKAGYPEKETPEATRQAACRLVTNRHVKAYIEHLKQVAATAAELTVEEIAVGVANVARADRRKMFAPDGTLLPPGQWPDDVADTLESAEVAETSGRRKKRYLKKVKTSPRMPAWAKLMEWRGMTGADKGEAGTAGKTPAVIEVPANGRSDTDNA